MSLEIEFRWTSRADACGFLLGLLRTTPPFPSRRPGAPHADNPRRIAAARLVAILAEADDAPALASHLLDPCEEPRVREFALEGLARLETSLAPRELAALFETWVADTARADDPWRSDRERRSALGPCRMSPGFMHWRLRRLLLTEADRAVAAPFLERLPVDRARFDAGPRTRIEPARTARDEDEEAATTLLARRLELACEGTLDDPTLLEAASGEDAIARYLAIEARDEPLALDAAWMARLSRLARDPDPVVRVRAFAAWARRGDDRALASLRRLARDARHPRIRAEALRGLADVDAAAHVEEFRRALSRDVGCRRRHLHRMAREEALRGLDRAGSAEALTALVRDALSDGGDLYLAQAVEGAAARFEGRGSLPGHTSPQHRRFRRLRRRPPAADDAGEGPALDGPATPDSAPREAATVRDFAWTTREDVCVQLRRFLEAARLDDDAALARAPDAPASWAVARLLRSLERAPGTTAPASPVAYAAPGIALPPASIDEALWRWRDPAARAAVAVNLERVDVRDLRSACGFAEMDPAGWTALFEGHPGKLAEAHEALLLPVPMLLAHVGRDRLLAIVEARLRDAGKALDGGLPPERLLADPDLEAVAPILREHPGERARILRSIRSAELAEIVYPIHEDASWVDDRRGVIDEARRRIRAFPSEFAARTAYVSTIRRATELTEPGDRAALLEAFESDEPGACYFAISGLEALGERSPAWHDRLEALARGDHPILRIRALAALARRDGADRVEGLRREATDAPHVLARAEALHRLRELDARAHVDLATRALREDRAPEHEHVYPMRRPAVDEAIALLVRAEAPETLTELLREALRGYLSSGWGRSTTDESRLSRRLTRAAWPAATLVEDDDDELEPPWDGLTPLGPRECV